MTSGKVLRETRERKGYDLTTVARRLRIRPDILRAIEAGDYSAMPPRGYTRNMVNAYARLLGLNPTEIVNMYLDEAYAVQVEKARDNAPSSGFDMSRASARGGRSRPRGLRDLSGTSKAQSEMTASGRSTYDPTTGRYTRTLYDDRTQFSHDDYGVTRERTERPGRSERDFLSHHSGYDSSGYGYAENPSRSYGRTIHVGQTPMQYSASRVPAFLQSRLALVLIAVAIIAIVLIVVFVVLGNRAAAPDDEANHTPISGVQDTTGTEDEENTIGQVEIAPTSARVMITVNQGKECYLDTYLDDAKESTPLSLVGPRQETIEVTGVWRATTYEPENVTITVDGVVLEPTMSPDDEYLGVYTVDFPAILAKWKETHPTKEAQRAAAVATATTASSSSSASASSSSASAAESETENVDEA